MRLPTGGHLASPCTDFEVASDHFDDDIDDDGFAWVGTFAWCNIIYSVGLVCSAFF